MGQRSGRDCFFHVLRSLIHLESRFFRRIRVHFDDDDAAIGRRLNDAALLHRAAATAAADSTATESGGFPSEAPGEEDASRAELRQLRPVFDTGKLRQLSHLSHPRMEAEMRTAPLRLAAGARLGSEVHG